MAKDEKESLWYRVWEHRSLKEKQRLRSFIPYILYGILVFYGIIYLSILNEVNRERTGVTVKTGFGGDTQAIVDTAEYINKDERCLNFLITVRDGLMICIKK